MQGRTERLFIGCGVGGTVLLFAGLVLGHLLPPPSPSWDATKITAFYRQHLAAMRWGSILMAFGAALIGPWLGVMAKDLKGIPRYGSIVAYCQTALGALLVFEIVLPVTVLQVVLFRLDRPVADTQALSDLFLVLFISPAYTFIVELLVTAVAIIGDAGTPRVFPRWFAALNVGTAVLSLPGILVIFVKSGPFTWNGDFGFWIPAVVFGIWIMVMTIGMLQRDAAIAKSS